MGTSELTRPRPTTAWRAHLRHWWRTRPVLAGGALLSAGVVLIWPPYASLTLGEMTIAVQTLGGSAALALGSGLILCGLALWTDPPRLWRWAIGVAALLFSAAALVAVNLGGFFIATLLGLLGAAGAVAWTSAGEPTRTSESSTDRSCG